MNQWNFISEFSFKNQGKVSKFYSPKCVGTLHGMGGGGGRPTPPRLTLPTQASNFQEVPSQNANDKIRGLHNDLPAIGQDSAAVWIKTDSRKPGSC